MKKKKVFVPKEDARGRKKRTALIVLFFFLSFLILAYRSLHLHLAEDDKLGRMAKNQYRTKIEEAPPRGHIYDADGNELAVSVPSYALAARPPRIKDLKGMVQTLSAILHRPAKELSTTLTSDKKYVWIKRDLSPQEKEGLSSISPELTKEGMELVKGSKRYYPNREVASQILGAVGRENEGLSGLELFYNKFLQGAIENSTAYRDARGKMFETVETLGKDVREAHQLKLTIRKNIQYAAEKEIEETCATSHAKSCTVIVMDPPTGAILAMASYPSFNPNAYQSYDVSLWRNIAVTDTFEPGSTFKTVVASAALEKNVVKPDEKFFCENGDLTIGKHTIHDHEKYGSLSVRDIIKVSSNIGTYKIARKLGRESFAEEIEKFGFGQRSGVDYPGEVNGYVRNVKKWQEIEFANIAFGQGVQVTPLQLASAYAAIANDGVRMKPYLVSEIRDSNGTVVQKNDPKVMAQVMSPKTAKLIREILTGVTEEGGTATRAALPGYSVAGKTGTAQKVIKGQYSHTKFVASFVGMVPAKQPRFVVLVTVDEPQGTIYGGLVAAPVFRNIAWAALTDMGVPRDQETGRVVVDKKPVEEPKKMIAEKPLPLREAGLISPGVPAQSSLEGEDRVTFPDLKGFSKRKVLAILDERHLACQLVGSGIVANQSPSAGSAVSEGQKCQVIFRAD